MGIPEESFLLFVYGTLRRGGGKDGLLEGARFLRPAIVSGSLYDLGHYPALVLDGRAIVHGEVWRCPTGALAAIDAYEGVDEGLFERVRVDIGSEGLAWTYVAGPLLITRLGAHNLVPSGRWRMPDAAPSDDE